MKPVLPLAELKARILRPKQNLYKAFNGNGLYVEVTTKGTKTVRLKYAINGIDKRHTFGRKPDITLKKARFAGQFKANLKSGTLPPIPDKSLTIKKMTGNFL